MTRARPRGTRARSSSMSAPPSCAAAGRRWSRAPRQAFRPTRSCSTRRSATRLTTSRSGRRSRSWSSWPSSTSTRPPARKWRRERTTGSSSRRDRRSSSYMGGGVRPTRMTPPIANAANVTARTRRRRGSSALFRAALVLALAVSCAFAAPLGIASFRSALSPGGGPTPSHQTASQVVMNGLESGACMGFDPAGGRGAKTVFIDPGHGGLDPGVVGMAGGRQVLEKDVTLAVATRLASLLRADGYRVVLSRTADSSVAKLSTSDSVAGAMTGSAVHRDLVARTLCANAAAASVLVSIHFDAFDDPSVGGTETFYDPVRPFAADNKRLANDLQAAVVVALGTSDRGVWTDEQLSAPTLTASGGQYGHLIELGPAAAGWVDSPSQMPGALIEPMFLTNSAEARVASQPAGQQKVAVALRAGLQKFFSGA